MKRDERLFQGRGARAALPAVALSCFLAAVSSAFCTDDFVSTPAGVIRLEVSSNSSMLVAMPFEPFDAAVGSIFSNQLTGATSEGTADRVVKWNASAQQYAVFFKADGTGDPDKDGKWFEAGTNWMVASETLSVGEGFWIENRHADQRVFLSGDVVLIDTQSVEFASGLNLFGVLYSTKTILNTTDLANDGASQGDQVQDAASNTCVFANGEWLNATGGVTDLVLKMGAGYWYNRVATNSLQWTEGRPYADLFDVGANAPRITTMVVNQSGQSVTLFVSCSGDVGETLEILSKDLADNDTFVSGAGWSAIEDGIATTGRMALTWVDPGAISGVFCRVYLVGRQDIDSDNDGLDDAREVFVHQTLAVKADTDADGLNDGAEINVYGTDPNNPDSDADGMGDGSEVCWDSSPTNADNFATLPWSEDFESRMLGDLDGQNGWLASEAVVQTGRVLHVSATGEAKHYYGALSVSSVWIDCSMRLYSGALPNIADHTNRATAVFAVNPEGEICGYDGFSNDWKISSRSPQPLGDWVRVTIKLDYGTHSWSLNINRVLELSGLGFKDETVNEFSRADWRGEAYLDDVQIRATEPEDLDDDNDALPNVWERLRGLDPNDPADANADADGDGLDNLQEYLLGTDLFNKDSDSDNMADGTEFFWGFNPVVSDSFQCPPWAAGFETNQGYVAGALQSQNAWQTIGSAVVQSGMVASGQQAVRIGGMETSSVSAITHFFGGPTGSVIWTDMKVKMVAGRLPEMGANAANLSAVCALNSQQELAGYDGSVHAWVVATNAPDVNPFEWLHLTVRKDYAAKVWSLYRDGALILANLGFADPSVDRLSRVHVEGGSSLGEYLDDLAIGAATPSHVDDDNDGIANIVEDANGNAVVDVGETDPFNPDTDGDGMADGTELGWGFDPVVSNSFSGLPWTAGLETEEGYAVGVLNGQAGWLAVTSVTVQSSVRYAGTNAVRMMTASTAEVQVAHYFGACGQTLVWIDMYTRLKPGVLPSVASISGSNSVLAAVNERGLLSAYDSQSHLWRTADSASVVDPSAWYRLTFRMDYARKSWSAYLDGKRVFRNIPFLNPSVCGLSRLNIRMLEGSGLPPDTYLDSMTAAADEPLMLDDDGDGMPNSWERQYSFDPENASDAAADPDRDGLSNSEEYQAGTNPGTSDTDGDGVSDGMEVHDMGTDPVSADITGISTVTSVRGGEVVDRLGAWAIEGRDIYALDRRGSLAYAMEAPVADTYRIEVEAAAQHPMFPTNDFDLLVYVDDEFLGRRILHTCGVSNAVVQVLTPWLPQGTHKVRVFVDNSAEYRWLRVKELRLQELLGPDTDSDGVKDWVEFLLARRCGVEIAPTSSVVSPVCVEGRGAFLSMMSVSGTQVQHALGEHWYANVPLSQTNETTIVSSFQNGGSVATNTICWTPLNLIDASNMTIRSGDSILLTAYPAGATNGTATIEVIGVTNYVTPIESPVVCTFETAGVFTVAGTCDNGAITSNSIQVTVADVAFDGTPACWFGKAAREWECPSLPANAVVEHDPRMAFEETDASTNGFRRFMMSVDAVEPRYVIARLSPVGPIMASTRIDGFRVRSTRETYVKVVERYENDDQLVETLVVLSPIIRDLSIKLQIIVGGITFDDGLTVKELTPADFNELGECRVRFIRPASASSSVCHTLRVYQNGVLLGER
ncbi:MAG TPA: hypothetical protein PLE77_04420 [Kiritimatiellia bacterium]|nr:hypothetical protein [Kiritimatiellia bacterium]